MLVQHLISITAMLSLIIQGNSIVSSLLITAVIMYTVYTIVAASCLL